MSTTSIDKLRHLLEIIPPLLEQTDAGAFSRKPAPLKWSKQEILGHLIDSAANNHQRFVRSQFEHTPSIAYDQDEWNRCSYYNRMDKKHLIDFWTAYNRHILALLEQMPAENLLCRCHTGGPEAFSLAYLLDDYVGHLEHHLRQIVEF